MCGICGAAWTDPARALSEGHLNRMVQRLHHRGPDDEGTYRDAHAALGFRRLSIIDVSGAHQPLSNEDGTVWTVFNGEIYNYQSLRNRLEATGHKLRSAGDSEVIVHLFEDVGAGLFELLRGMFALAIWDSKRQTLILGRDRMGQKPLVYRADRERISFASELKALLELPNSDLPRRPDPLALDRYLTYGYVPHPRTILTGVHKLPPAHYAIWHGGKLTLERYWEPDWNAEINRPIDEDAERLRDLVADAVREQMMSDVPLGAFLSGGIDSTIVAGLMQRVSNRPVKTFSIGFLDPAFDETKYAELAAKQLETDHHTFRVDPNAWETLPALAEQFDEPFADSSALPTWHVARETRKHVTVALTGDAGDELFGGYDRYRALALCGTFDRLPERLRGFIGGPMAGGIPASSRAKTRLRSLKRLLQGVARPPDSSRYLGWMILFDEFSREALYTDEFIDDILAASAELGDDADPASELALAWNAGRRRDPVTKAMIADLQTYLPDDLLFKVDMASMAHSLECRGPFLDHRVVELALAMPWKHKLRASGRSKIVLKQAFADLLPQRITQRRKMGFGVPIDRWFRAELLDPLRSVLLDRRTIERGLFRVEVVEALLDQHAQGRRDHAYRLWALLMLELWFRHHLDSTPAAHALADSAGITR